MWGLIISDEEASFVFKESPSLELWTPGVVTLLKVIEVVGLRFVVQKKPYEPSNSPVCV